MGFTATNSSTTTELIDDNRNLTNFRQFSGNDSAVGNTNAATVDNKWMRCDHRNLTGSSTISNFDLFSNDYTTSYKKHLVVFNSVNADTTNGTYSAIRIWVRATNGQNYLISTSTAYKNVGRRSSNYVSRNNTSFIPLSYYYNYGGYGHGSHNGWCEFWTDSATKFTVFHGETRNYQNSSYMNFWSFSGMFADERKFAGIQFLPHSGSYNFRRNEGASATLYRSV